MPNVMYVLCLGRQLAADFLFLLSLEEGIAEAAAAATAVRAVGLALNGHAPHHGEGGGQGLELGHNLTTANLLRDMMGSTAGLRHAVELQKSNNCILISVLMGDISWFNFIN